jgi:hypothetical protein
MVMRSFSSEEKGYLKHIVDAYKSEDWEKMKLSNIFYSIFNRKVDFKSHFPSFELKDGESKDKKNPQYGKAIKEGYIPLSNFDSLMIYLNSNHLITIVPFFEREKAIADDSENDNCFPQINDNFINIEKDSYLEFLRSNMSDFVCPTQELIDFVDDNFISKQDKQFNETMRLSKWGIGTALFIGIFSLIIGIIGLFHKTPVVSNTFNPHAIVKNKEDVNSVTQKPNTVDSLKVNQSKKK